ncbi:hypothetical protein AB0E78_23945 [Streptomyces sp. NPDC032198]|uniref:hypothetical protein n=1 Tax=Streptomyces sp. NPDC032198 TaxID=3155127 RepID=UPI0033E34C01
MRLPPHRPDARLSYAVLLYDGDTDGPDAYRRRPGCDGDRNCDGYDPESGHALVCEHNPYEWNRRNHGRRPSGPPPATRALRDALTRWPDSLFHAEPDRVAVLDITSPEGARRFDDVIRDARDLLLVHYSGAAGSGDPYSRASGRGGLPVSELAEAARMSPAQHIVMVLEPDWSADVSHERTIRSLYDHVAGLRLLADFTLIVTRPDPRPRPFLADALGADGPVSTRTLAAHTRAQVLAQAHGRDVRLTESGRRGGGRPAVRHSSTTPSALYRTLDRTRPALTKARESTASALSAAAPFALLLLAVAVVAGGLFALLRALPPMRGTWAAVVLLGLWAVLAVIGIITRLRTPPTRARPPDKASSPAPRSQAFMDGMWAAWGFPGPVPQPTGRPRQPIPARPTREESRAAVERSLNALYARLPVPQMRAPDPPPSPAASSSPSPDDNGTTP